MLPAVCWQRYTVPDVGFTCFEMKALAKLSDSLFIKGHPAICCKLPIDHGRVTVAPRRETLPDYFWIIGAHCLHKLLLGSDAREGCRDMRLNRRRQGSVELQHPEGAYMLYAGSGTLSHAGKISPLHYHAARNTASICAASVIGLGLLWTARLCRDTCAK